MEAIAAKTYVANTTTTVTENRIEFMPLETTDGVQKLYGHLSKQAEKLGLPVPELYMSAAVLILPGRPWSVRRLYAGWVRRL